MWKFLSVLVCAAASQIQAIEFKPFIDNHQMCVAYIKILPHEEIGLHRDAYPQIVTALKGGVITRIEEDGRMVDVEFPTDVSVYRPADPEGEFHRSFNPSDEPLEMMVLQIKTKKVDAVLAKFKQMGLLP